MKYVLKKDTPFALAGEEVFIHNGLCVNTSAGERRIDVLPESYGNFLADEIRRLISQGWIEEVKPREWHKILYKPQNHMWKKNFCDYESAENFLKVSIQGTTRDIMQFEIIKVREVLP